MRSRPATRGARSRQEERSHLTVSFDLRRQGKRSSSRSTRLTGREKAVWHDVAALVRYSYRAWRRTRTRGRVSSRLDQRSRGPAPASHALWLAISTALLRWREKEAPLRASTAVCDGFPSCSSSFEPGERAHSSRRGLGRPARPAHRQPRDAERVSRATKAQGRARARIRQLEKVGAEGLVRSSFSPLSFSPALTSSTSAVRTDKTAIRPPLALFERTSSHGAS